ERGLRGRTRGGWAGARLLVRLARTTAGLAAGLGVVGAPARGSTLGDDDLVDQRDVELDGEHLGGELGGAGLLALGVQHVNGQSGQDARSPSAALRTRTSPPFGT